MANPDAQSIKLVLSRGTGGQRLPHAVPVLFPPASRVRARSLQAVNSAR